MSEKHCHKFRRHIYDTGKKVFFCVMPDCSVKITPALTLGKKSICWRCGETFLMTEYSIKLAKPHCENCHKPKTSAIADEVSEFTKGQFDYVADRVKDDSLNEMRNKLSGISTKDEEGEI